MTFIFEQAALVFDAPAVAGELTIRANDTMARNSERNRIGRASVCHHASSDLRIDVVDKPSEVRVAHRLPDGDRTDLPPDPLLKQWSAHVEREVESIGGPFRVAGHLRQVVADHDFVFDASGFWKTAREVRF